MSFRHSAECRNVILHELNLGKLKKKKKCLAFTFYGPSRPDGLVFGLPQLVQVSAFVPLPTASRSFPLNVMLVRVVVLFKEKMPLAVPTFFCVWFWKVVFETERDETLLRFSPF